MRFKLGRSASIGLGALIFILVTIGVAAVISYYLYTVAMHVAKRPLLRVTGASLVHSGGNNWKLVISLANDGTATYDGQATVHLEGGKSASIGNIALNPGEAESYSVDITGYDVGDKAQVFGSLEVKGQTITFSAVVVRS